MSENTEPEIQETVVILHKMSADEEKREIARLREKAIRDERSAMNYARREGFEIGWKTCYKEGWKICIEKGTEEIISKLRSKGFTDEQIKDILS